MHTSLLWFDNDASASLSVKVQKAVGYYHKKYGRQPDLCLVHPSMITDFGNRHSQFTILVSETEKIKIRPYLPVLPGHIWIGIEDKS